MSTSTVRYIGPFPEGVSIVTGLGTEVVVEHGATVEVSAGQAEALLLQAANWEIVEVPLPDDAPAADEEAPPKRGRKQD